MTSSYIKIDDKKKQQALFQTIKPLEQELSHYIDNADIVYLVKEDVKEVYEVKSIKYGRPMRDFLAVSYVTGTPLEKQPDKPFLSIIRTLRYNANRKQQSLALHIQL